MALRDLAGLERLGRAGVKPVLRPDVPGPAGSEVGKEALFQSVGGGGASPPMGPAGAGVLRGRPSGSPYARRDPRRPRRGRGGDRWIPPY